MVLRAQEHGRALADIGGKGLFTKEIEQALFDNRVSIVTKVWAGTFEDYQTRHFVQRIACTPKGGDLYNTVSNFSVFYTDSAGNTGILVTGRYVDEIAVNGDGAKLKSRRAVMDTNVAPRYIVYPI